ncbi:MAG: hypothetical protein COY38_03040 [Candidatus Aenigmarchaeota archaeon CG_4_10_14_0_8_um_filter_37_24]|nr:hypothetical protein [Candidatus Aenigmarchaeota archaeon]OIN87155.1 MAG: hypothetical protein AUJ50_03220 [Candidatus Aenigmarchaeota archaeon CG1_02_38_14]PIV68218.1 MAG: hypothetical protein COS07_04860 [Candidatus Aenigmarchaeota archaeon CG01_land_8_20_14_3_00_37_9]PIW41559.1 MAG: hypothetical protein COW21_01550 [Candidatus Aenigmarchaeota archaeon CG15_BIG_FIL_POST_REV_8_21_14_020_37_27]PIX51104.1 MAG: hypothetical protein COZ52_00900 [Candidatus Aenigmarchaeota archaeon CG_4_8_14_3_u
MEVKKIKDESGILMLELEGESKTFANLLSEELWNDANISEAAPIKEHPYMEQPKLFMKMKGKSKPEKALADAGKRIEVKVKDLEKEFLRALK